MRVRGLGTLAAAMLAAHALGAQQVRGVVFDSVAGAPIAGAVVTALDSAGSTRGRTITGASGRFALERAPGTARLSVIRIGYSPRSLPLHAGDDSNALRIAMHRLPPMLEAVRVTGQELCPGSAQRGGAFELWEQARAGLLAELVTREEKPAHATMVMFDRTLSPDDDLVRSMRVKTESGSTTRPFVSPEAASALAQHGYMREDPDGSRVFAAPDADVLLDESFATVHCFHLQPADTAHTGQVGLAFSPIAAHDTLVDVSGVIWMDAARPAVRTLEFRYTSLEPAARDANAGGVIHFRTMSNGVSFIDRWIMRLPALTEQRSRERTIRDGAQFRRSRTTNFNAHVSAIVESGGGVLSATWPDGVSWTASRTGISGRITADGKPASGAVVSLRGTTYRATANANGEFALAPVAPGSYELLATDTTLIDYVDERRATRTVRVLADTVTPFTLELPRFAEMVDRLCHRRDMPKETSVLLGQIVTAQGVPDPNLHIRATWQANYNSGQFVTPGRDVRINGASQETNTDDQGRFSICGVVAQRPIHLRATRGRAFADTVITLLPDSIFKTLRWSPALAAPHERQ